MNDGRMYMFRKGIVAGVALTASVLFPQFAMASSGTYTVQNGDTMYLIAQNQGVSLTALEDANPQITNYADIWTGETLNLPAPNATNTAASLIATAESYIGVPYQWGGDSPATGFDCSGFTEYVFAKYGITLPRESHDQAQVGTFIPANQLQPGDLVFFSDTYTNSYANGVTHVGIYIGNGNMIESSSTHNNIGVIIVHNFWASPYYNAHYWGSRRVL